MSTGSYGSNPTGKKNSLSGGKTSSRTYTPNTGPGNQYTPKGPAVTPDVHRIKGGHGAGGDNVHPSLKKGK